MSPTNQTKGGTPLSGVAPLHILNLGAGVQSTALYLMSLRQDEPEHVPVFDAAIFADTQEEPRAVYEHLEWLKSLNGPPILSRTFGKLGDDLIHGHHMVQRSETAKYRPGQIVPKFFRIPAFVKNASGTRGMMSRECTRTYKVEVVERTIREELLGLNRGQRFPKDVTVYQYFGLSFDEPGRVVRSKARAELGGWFNPRFPLFDLEMTRGDCLGYLRVNAPHEVPRSACTFCPFRSDAHWQWLRDHDPEAWERACEIDEAIRRPDAACALDLDGQLYLHGSCVPLRDAPLGLGRDLPGQAMFGFAQECEGMCGV